MAFGGVVSGNIRGLRELQAKLIQVPVELWKDVEKAMIAEANVEKRESIRRTPWKTRRLQRSHRVGKFQHPRPNGRKTFAIGIFAGSTVVSKDTAWYAVIVHENVFANFKHGQAKFLESTLRESAPYMAGRIERRLDLRKIVGPVTRQRRR